MKRMLLPALVAAAAFCAPAAWAHDFFLLPERFEESGAVPIAIRATVGSGFPAAETAVAADRIDRLAVKGTGSPRVAVAGAGPHALNLQVTGAKPGLLVVGVATKARDVDYEEDRIPLILGEYRVGAEAAAAVEALPRPRTWRVSSRRFAKTFVCVRTCAARAVARQAFGAPLEFVAHGSAAGRFLVLGQGRPLADHAVDLVGSDGKRRHLTSDARGEIRLPAGARGTMMLFAAKLTKPAEGGRFTLDLSSLTFTL